MKTLTRKNNENAALIFLAIFFALNSANALATVSNFHTPEDQILAKGFSAYMDGKDKQALSYFEEAARINPKNKAAQKGLDKVKIRLKKKEDADKAKAKVLAKSKMREGQELMKTGDIVAAIDSFHIALDAIPGYKPALSEIKDIKLRMNKELDRKRLNLTLFAFNRGVVAYLDRDWAKAFRIWSERSKMEPTNVALSNATARAENNFRKMMLAEREDFFRRGGRAFYEQGLFSQAINSWSKVLELDSDDAEALEGKARAEVALLAAQGKGHESQVHDLLEQGLEQYANQNWKKARDTFQALLQLDPDFGTANEYIIKLNENWLPEYNPVVGASHSEGWKKQQPSNQGESTTHLSDKQQNYPAAKLELESQLKRDPTNIRIQQELDKVTKIQDDESERIYKDGLIAYSQGNRSQAIQKWKEVLLINPDHKKALAAMKKARAEEERTEEPGGQQ